MRGLALVSLFLLVAPLQADELSLEQIIALMETNRARRTAPAPKAEQKSVSPVQRQSNGFQLDQIVALATTNDVRLAPYSSALKLAQYRSDASVQYDNPELRMGTELNGSDPGQRASVRFYPPNPWRVGAEKDENSALVGEENAAYQSALLETMIDVISAYHELQCLETEKELYDRLVNIKKGFAVRVDEQVAAAVGTQAQGLLALWEMQEALEDRRNTEIQAEQLKQSLAVLTGQPADRFTIAPLKGDDSFAPINPEESTRIAMGYRPRLQLLRAQRAAADARLRGAKAAGVPWLNFVELGYRTRSDQWELEAGFELPFFTLGGTDKMLAYEELSLRNIEIETQEQRLRFEVGAAVKAYNVAVDEWTQLQDRQRVLIQKTRAYLDRTSDDDPKRMQERVSLEEKLIRAEFKMLDIRRRINQTRVELISMVGQPI
jgi:outer membrane protein TolC